MSSILLTVRQSLGIQNDFDGFDGEIIVAINTAFMSLNQLGVGPEDGFVVSEVTDTWESFLGDGVTNLEGVKSYICLKARLLFDPPTSSYLLEAIQRSLNELEWRLNVEVEPDPETA